MGLKISKDLQDAMKRNSKIDSGNCESKLIMSKDMKEALDRDGGKIYGYESKGFRIAGDMDLSSGSEKSDNHNHNYTGNGYDGDRTDIEEIQKYLDKISSGIRYDSNSERGMVCEEGDTIVFSMDEVVDMVEKGYNIISANCLNKDVIQIKYQGFMKGRGR